MTKNKIHNFGFVRPKEDPKGYILGSLRSLPQHVLQADGNWGAYLPTYEPQFGDGGWDTDGCTDWGTLNVIETLFRKIFGIEANYSERFIYNLVPIFPPGSDPHLVAECIRVRGLIDQDKLPMTATYADFILPNPMTPELLTLGLEWLQKNGFGHEWVFQSHHSQLDRIALMKQALQYSPLGVSVTAWFQGDDGIYRDRGEANCHWCECYGWDDEKRAWKIFDSYDQSQKLYSFDSEISFCKRYSLSALSQAEPVKKNNGFLELIKSIFSLFFTWKQ